jgi:hypothetical protein
MIYETGGCQCGNIRYELLGEPTMLYVCHCKDCQKQSASAFGMSLIVNPVDIRFTKGEALLRHWDTRGENGAIKRCLFCPDCGTRIIHGSDDPLETVSIKAGSLDDTSGLRPVANIWLKSAQPWVSVDSEHSLCFEEEPEDEAELHRLWQAQHADD